MKYIFNSKYRYRKNLERNQKRNLHHSSEFTKYNRYPSIFKLVQTLYSNQESLKILSFGCSTGEEVKALRELYFPEATIVGTDINKKSLDKAIKSYRKENVYFIKSEQEEINKHGPYDIIFCMAVFQHRKNRDIATQNSEPHYPFLKFEGTIIQLDKLLNKGGAFIIEHTDYNFLETSISNKYTPVPNQNFYRNRPLYNKNNERISEKSIPEKIFIKQG